MLLRVFIRRVVKASRMIRPRERAAIVAMWRVGFPPKAAAAWLRAVDRRPDLPPPLSNPSR